MTSAHQLSSRLREVIFDGKFIANTNFKQELSDLHWEAAEQKIGTLNTIAALAQHIHYYIHGVNKVLHGGTLDIHDKYSFDFPPFTNQDDWTSFLKTFFSDAEAYTVAIASLGDTKLSDFFVDEKYGTYHRNIDAMIEHCYYHLGQIVLIKKLVSQ